MLADRILTYVTKVNGLVSLNKLVSLSGDAGFSENETLAAIDKLGKKLKGTVRGNEVYYSIPPPKKTPVDHLRWVRENYVRPSKCEHGVEYTSCEHCKPFPMWNLDWMFLKTKEERDAFLAEMKGGGIRYNKKRYAKEKK